MMNKSELKQIIKEEIHKVFNEIRINPPKSLKDITSELEKAGLSFDDGILGGVGSGGGGYYDSISDKISGYNLDEFNEEAFNNWYDNFSKDSFNSYTYESEFSEENEDDINYDIIRKIGKGIYSVGEPGYDGGYAEIHENGDITLYAVPTLTDEEGNDFIPIFLLTASGKIIPKEDKSKIKNLLSQNINSPGSWAII